MDFVQDAGLWFMGCFNAIIGALNGILDWLGIPLDIDPLEW
jgi:hypothetical protein